jgi:hypothetical protein
MRAFFAPVCTARCLKNGSGKKRNTLAVSMVKMRPADRSLCVSTSRNFFRGKALGFSGAFL